MDLTNKKELKRVWLEALRSGEYKQTQGTLHNLDDGGFCCLGVAAKVWGVATPEQMGVTTYKSSYGEMIPSCEGDIMLYDALDRLSGSIGTSGMRRHDAFEKGIDMNDRGKTFTEIADMIEKEWDV